MLKIALTGSIASGKSAVLRFFKEQGIATLDSDEIVKELYKKQEVKEKIFKLFHTLERQKIAEAIFSSPLKRKELEKILHPPVLQELEKRIAKLRAKDKKIVVVEVPLLFEAGLERLFDKVIAVNCSREQQVARLQDQGLSHQEALQRINAQLSSEEKVKKSDFVIDNSRSLQHALQQAEKILGELNG